MILKSILENPSMLLVLLMIFLLSGEILLLIFSAVFAVCSCSLCYYYSVLEIQLSKTFKNSINYQEISKSRFIVKFVLTQNFFLFLYKQCLKKRGFNISPYSRLEKGRNIAATLSFYVDNFCVPNKLARLGQARLGIKGFATLLCNAVYPVIFMLPDH